MNFLLDTDTCSTHMRRPSQLATQNIPGLRLQDWLIP
jgi:hypothetical protein